MDNEVYKRSHDLIEKYLTFVKRIRTVNTSQNVTIKTLIELKSVLSNIHNVLTLIATLTATKKIADVLSYEKKQENDLLRSVESKKANSNGFDIEIRDSYGNKILAEVKCNVLIHSEKLGAQQVRNILNDVRKLRNELPEGEGRKIKIDTSEYIKLIVLVDLYQEKLGKVIKFITRETNCKESTKKDRKHRESMKRYIKYLESWSKLKDINDLGNVYLVTISLDEMEKELQCIMLESIGL